MKTLDSNTKQIALAELLKWSRISFLDRGVSKNKSSIAITSLQEALMKVMSL